MIAFNDAPMVKPDLMDLVVHGGRAFRWGLQTSLPSRFLAVLRLLGSVAFGSVTGIMARLIQLGFTISHVALKESMRP